MSVRGGESGVGESGTGEAGGGPPPRAGPVVAVRGASSKVVGCSDIARAERSERLFWWRVAAILALACTLGSMGVMRVRERSAGVRTAYQLARVHDALREQVEENRRLSATLSGRKDPTRLQAEATGRLHMRTPQPDETWEIAP